ncbi:Serine protease 40 [Tupaia chinensis]|uniref:Serine protease 40 n=1 Tax=Tupaia chinensis TaxID=246437 RepID=L8Y427_TUPCH|nr:Serine protease 40 [Tupaia chinensis]
MARVVSTECGKSTVTGKIFGGKKANPERWPWQASLLLNGRHICGATLIDRNWVASAAHCFQRSHSPSDYRILLGYNQLHHPTNYSRQMTVRTVIVHSEYDKQHRMGSDITLLQLHVSVDFNSHISPACVPDSSTVLNTSRTCWISGWGMITEDTFLPRPFQLQEGEVGIIENRFCANFFQPENPSKPSNRDYGIYDDMLCAGNLMEETSICRGDSGGPLVCPVNGKWYLIGISSWSLDCRSPIGPSVFTRVSYFSNWIKENKKITPTPSPSEIPSQGTPPALGSMVSLGTVHRPGACAALVSAQTFLLLLLVPGSL